MMLVSWLGGIHMYTHLSKQSKVRERKKENEKKTDLETLPYDMLAALPYQ
jgi:hypothetical protein